MPHPCSRLLSTRAASSAAAATPTSANAVAGDDTSAKRCAPGTAAATTGVGTVDASTRASVIRQGTVARAAVGPGGPSTRGVGDGAVGEFVGADPLGWRPRLHRSFAALRYLAAAAARQCSGGEPAAQAAVERRSVRRLAALGLPSTRSPKAQFVAIAHQPLATTTVLLASTPC